MNKYKKNSYNKIRERKNVLTRVKTCDIIFIERRNYDNRQKSDKESGS